MSNYYYLDVSLETKEELSIVYFKKHVVDAIQRLFGETASSVNVDVLKYDPETKRGLLRIPRDRYVQLRCSLTLYDTNYNFYVHKAAPLLLNLLGERPNGKDLVIFATAEDHKIASTIKLPPLDPQPGLILDNGDINWNCPCLGGMATGPCGVEFRNAFSCFHYSDSEPKGSDCYDLFKSMQTCMQKYPTLYNKDLGEDDDMTQAIEQSQAASKMEEASKETKG